MRRRRETRAAAWAAATAGLSPVRSSPFVRKGEGAELEGETRRGRVGRSAMCKHDRSPSVDVAPAAPLVGTTDNDLTDGFAREKSKMAHKKLFLCRSEAISGCRLVRPTARSLGTGGNPLLLLTTSPAANIPANPSRPAIRRYRRGVAALLRPNLGLVLPTVGRPNAAAEGQKDRDVEQRPAGSASREFGHRRSA